MQTKKETRNTTDKMATLLPIPFSMCITPIEALLFMTFEQDPDSIYSAFEVQRLNDELQGTGQLIIGWRVDGKVDIFHDPQLRLDPGGYDVCAGGLAHMVARDFKNSFFTVGASGMEANISFEDLQGRFIELRIREQSRKAPRPFGFLAPVGEGSENPSSMPILMLHDFYFVRRKGTEISITIDGRSHNPDVINFPIDWSIMYFARYTPDPLALFLNPAFKGPVSTLAVTGEARVIEADTTYEVEYLKGIPVLKAIQREHNGHTVNLSFEPAFPNLSAFKGSSASGEFLIKGDPALGKIEGNYTVTKDADELKIILVPSGGWIPKKERLGIRILYTVVGFFRNWPRSYQWTAMVQEIQDGKLQMDSSWERTR